MSSPEPKFDPNKIYKIRLTATGSSVNPTDDIEIRASLKSAPSTYASLPTLTGSLTIGGSNVITGGSSQVSNWQSGILISGSDIKNAYSASTTVDTNNFHSVQLLNISEGDCEFIATTIEFISLQPKCYPVALRYSADSSQDACFEPSIAQQEYGSDSPDLEFATTIYTNSDCTTGAPAGFYSTGQPGERWYEVVNSSVVAGSYLGQIIASGSCII